MAGNGRSSVHADLLSGEHVLSGLRERSMTDVGEVDDDTLACAYIHALCA